MAFKLIIVLCATLAFTNAGLLTAPAAYSSAPAVSHVYSSIGSVQQHQPAVIAHGKFYSNFIINSNQVSGQN